MTLPRIGLSAALLCAFLLPPLAGQTLVKVKIDFGSSNSLSGGTWNNISLPRTGTLDQLVDNKGVVSGYKLKVVDSFNGINQSGTVNPDTVLNIPSTASGDSFYGNERLFNEVVEPSAAIEILDLDTSRSYSLSLFASRIATDNRETKYKVIGLKTDSALLQVSNNTKEVATFKEVIPNKDGVIRVECSAGPANDNAYGFYYLGALEMEYLEDRPADPFLQIVHPYDGAIWQVGKRPEIRWNSQAISELELAYSIDDGQQWTLIDTVAAFTGRYPWPIPDLTTEAAKIRLRSTSLESISEGLFTITDDTSNCHIVVLGSSTAAGTGPSTRDSAWVWRYRDYLFQTDSRFSVTNLARGGFTTYNILPDEAIVPDSINQTIDSLRNVSRAIELAPNGIIINLPSNDAARGYPVVDQLRNYEWILSDLNRLDIPYWICTPQARNNFSEEQVQIQRDMVDSTYAIFGKGAIDFWSELGTPEGFIQEKYDSGDGVHLNNLAHRILLQRVLKEGVKDSLLRSKQGEVVSTPNILAESQFKLFPNPSSGLIQIQPIGHTSEDWSISIFNQQLEKLPDFDSRYVSDNKQIMTLDISKLSRGIYILIIRNPKHQIFEAKRIIKW